ncbi:MAG: amidase [Rhizobiales bacterium]|nr:amidase [Hyphomicrobiales bacterium]
MRIDEYVRKDGLGLAGLIARKEISALEVMDAALAAHAAINPEINAVVELYSDARDTSKLRSGRFHGVPYLVKDVGFHFKGRRAEQGSRLCAGTVVAEDDYFAKLVYASGVNLLGRSNVPEFSMALCADNLLHGTTSNPWKKGYSTSGSSGGAAAAVAAGIVPVAHASDMGGSTRGPAAWCGTVGLQPSRGRVSAGPGEDEHGFGMAQAFCVTRSLRDTAAMLDRLGQPMPGDPYVIARPDRPWADFLAGSRRRFRVGWSAKPLMDAPVDPEIAAAVERVALVLAEHGCDVEEAQPKIDLAAMDEGCKNLWYFQFDKYLDGLGELAGRKVGPDTVEKATLKFYEFAKRQTADAFFAAMAVFNRLRRDMGAFFQTYDVWLSPTCAQVAQPNGVYGMNIDIGPEEFLIHEQRPCQFMVPYNVAGQPALSLPLAMHSNGLPIGVQLGARHAEEYVLIELGALLETAMPWRNRRPPLHGLPA